MRASPPIFFSNRWAMSDLAGVERTWLMSGEPENAILPPCMQPMNSISGLCSNSCVHDSPNVFGEKESDPILGKLVGRLGLEPGTTGLKVHAPTCRSLVKSICCSVFNSYPSPILARLKWTRSRLPSGLLTTIWAQNSAPLVFGGSVIQQCGTWHPIVNLANPAA